MATSQEVITGASRKGSMVQDWKTKNESKIKEIKYSIHLFRKSPLAVLGFLIILSFFLVAIFAPWIAPYSAEHRDWKQLKLAPSDEHLFGTDDTGGDIFSRVIWGTRISLYIGFSVVLVSVLVGTVVGAISGYYGGKIDEVMMRITDIFLAFPSLVLAMVICASLGRSIENVMLAMTIVWWPIYARLVRGQALSIRERTYIEAAKAIGANDRRIILKHLAPNCLSPIIVQATMDLGTVILVAAGLSFIGFGAKPGQAEWGRMISEGAAYMMNQPWMATFPGLAILIVCLGFNLFGDGLRDILDPRQRR
ncbi:D-ala-D-ala transporter subunit [Methanocella sp. CWC-04]|uniref:D-ala-D-ala transporter subunit n=1 Tax=Methanooceanicella nereidis TaxID=2052831 RepID=A0AAP2RAN9_9EURY|nr:ABC transporter permease [Methanocella sp. CWC-04]MCD1293853.1 D-ala-D-ala transporter subunit [Methanocella sp. CWC-04]